MKVKYIALLAAVSLLSMGVVSCNQNVDTTSPNTEVKENPCAGVNPCAGKNPCAGETK